MPWILDGWQGIHRLTDRTETPWYEACEDSSGVYRLIALRQKEACDPDVLDRVCGRDVTGTIYVGSAKNLKPRISALVKTHNPIFITKNHKPLPNKLAEKYPPSRLALSFKYTEDAFMARAEEIALLASYLAEFGEHPPLNSHG